MTENYRPCKLLIVTNWANLEHKVLRTKKHKQKEKGESDIHLLNMLNIWNKANEKQKKKKKITF